MKNDIVTTDDIKLLVDEFYMKIKTHPELGNVFVNVMNINWDTHLPKMYNFWEYILFHTGDYKGRPFPPHINVNSKFNLTPQLFDAWILLFENTVDEFFVGVNANKIKEKAKNIKTIWSIKFLHINKVHA